MNKLVMLAVLGSLSAVAGCASTGGSPSAPPSAPSSAAPAASAGGAACAGNWTLNFETPMGAQAVPVTLTQNGEQLTGKASDPMAGDTDVNGTCKGNAIVLLEKVNAPMGELLVEFSGTVSGDSMSGTVKLGDFGSSPFTGKKQ